MDYTGERMIPDCNSGQETYAEHLLRYEFSAQFVKGKVVLDVACGSGYGTSYLARQGAMRVYGLDISQDAVEYAERHYFHEKCEFVVADAENMPWPNDFFDVIISFETLEHVRNCGIFLDQVRRLLKPDGLFVVSTPNRALSHSNNPFHLKEFYVEELERELKSRYENVRLFSQSTFTLQSLYDVAPSSHFEVAQGTLERGSQYVLGVCSSLQLQINIEGYGRLGAWKEKEQRDLVDYIHKLEKECDECRSRRDGSESSLKACATELKDLEAKMVKMCEESKTHEGASEMLRSDLTLLRREREVLQGVLFEKEHEKNVLLGQLKNLNEELSSSRHSLDASKKNLQSLEGKFQEFEDNAKLALQSYESQLHKAQIIQDSFNKQIEGFVSVNSNVNTALKSLQNEFLAHRFSFSYRLGRFLTFPFRFIFDFFVAPFFPPGTRRGLFLVVVLRCLNRPFLFLRFLSPWMIGSVFRWIVEGNVDRISQLLIPGVLPQVTPSQSNEFQSPLSQVVQKYGFYFDAHPLAVSDKISIIVCFAGNTSLLERCGRALFEFTPTDLFELHVVVHQQDVSRIPVWITQRAHLHTHSMENFSFAKANNLVLEKVEVDCVLLNDDVEVTPGWLSSLRKASRGFALVGARTSRGNAGNPDLWGEGPLSLTQYPINMYCTFIPYRLRQVVGLLNEEYVYYGGEDVDYSCRVLKNGFPLVISDAYVHHVSSQSYGTDKEILVKESDVLLEEFHGVQPPYFLGALEPLVSVIIATKNRKQLLLRSIRSLVSGEYKNFEIIVVDDASTDGTREAIANLQSSEPRVKAVCLPKSVGCVAARNHGVGLSSGEFIAFMDDDDVAKSNRITAPLDFLRRNPLLDAVYCAFEVVSDGMRSAGRTQPFSLEEYGEGKFDIGSGVLLLRKHAVISVPFMKKFDRAIDFDWVFRFIRRGFSLGYCPEVVLEYHRHGVPEDHLSGNAESIRVHEEIKRRERLLATKRRV